jgi:hypothetical protein
MQSKESLCCQEKTTRLSSILGVSSMRPSSSQEGKYVEYHPHTWLVSMSSEI